MHSNKMTRPISARPAVLVALIFIWTVCAVSVEPAFAADHLLTRLQDSPVFNAQMEDMGAIEDLVVRRSGKIKSVLIAVNGFLAGGGQDVAVPFRKTSLDAKGRLKLDKTVSALEQLPPFDYDQNGLYTGTLYQPPPVNHKWQYPFYAPPYDPFSPRPHWQKDWPYSYDQQDIPRGYWQRNPRFRVEFPPKFLASSLLGQYVLNKKGWEIAEVADLLVDENGYISQLLFDVGGFLEIGEKTVAVPFKPLRFNAFGVIYDISRDTLKNLPAYTATNGKSPLIKSTPDLWAELFAPGSSRRHSSLLPGNPAGRP